MKKTDMELQAIREKLQMLQAEPPAAEVIALPWAPATAKVTRADRPSTQLSTEVSEGADSPQALAIEALRQRSHGSDQAALAAQAKIDSLIAQEIYRLEVQAHHINARSQQQAADILAMQRSAQQAAVTLARQGIQGHPLQAVIAQFLADAPAAAVPHITRDQQGHFALTHNTIDFHRAEHEAVDTANSLRNRQQAKPGLFSQPIESNPSAISEALRNTEASTGRSGATDRIKAPKMQTAVEGVIQFLGQLLNRGRRHRRQAMGLSSQVNSTFFGEVEEGFMDDPLEGYFLGEHFTLFDSMIWFSGAAIAGFAIKAITASFPLIKTSLLVAIASLIAFALYRAFTLKAADRSLIPRLCLAAAGLMLAILF
ncbi:MAG: hypothetical protein WA885_06315 [Phormidesmis sp.]